MAASPSRSSSSTAETKKFAQRSLLPARAASTRAMAPPPRPRPGPLAHHRQDRALVAQAFGAFEHAFEGGREARIAARDAAGLIHGRDRHWGVLEEAREAHFGRAARIAAIVLCP